jgi:aryl-alcohol dehydrogenase-like predicted oxidoreductase
VAADNPPSRSAAEGQYFTHLRDERRIDAVEQLIPVADEAGLPLTHLAMAFAIAHPGVTAALLGPRTLEQRGSTRSWPTAASTSSSTSPGPTDAIPACAGCSAT